MAGVDERCRGVFCSLTEARLCSDPDNLLYRLPLGSRLQEGQFLEFSERLRF